MGVLIEGDFLDSGADVRHPRWIDDRERFDADARRRQRELDGMRRHFEGVRRALFHPRPHLVPGPPQHLKPVPIAFVSTTTVHLPSHSGTTQLFFKFHISFTCNRRSHQILTSINFHSINIKHSETNSTPTGIRRQANKNPRCRNSPPIPHTNSSFEDVMITVASS